MGIRLANTSEPSHMRSCLKKNRKCPATAYGHVRFANALREAPMPVLCFRLAIAAIVIVCFTGGYNVGYLKFTLAPSWNPF
jgi:hypothetical protein